MVSDATALALDITRFTCGALTVLLGLRIAYVLSANPIGEFTSELVYLRGKELRQAGWAILLVLLVEIAQAIIPFFQRQRWTSELADLHLFLDTAQALVILIAATMIVLVVGRYTHRALDRRIRESMETLAYLEGQRRRRRSAERGEWDRSADEDE